jgi:hypothetical protein
MGWRREDITSIEQLRIHLHKIAYGEVKNLSKIYWNEIETLHFHRYLLFR